MNFSPKLLVPWPAPFHGIAAQGDNAKQTLFTPALTWKDRNMKFFNCLALLALLIAVTGCSQEAAPDADATTPATATNESDSPASGSETPADANDESAGETTALTPENTKIEFVGNHTGEKKDPRQGSFQQFTGEAVVDGTLKSVSVDIETASITTEIDKLTNHLKNADFFDVNQYPKASFQSTEIVDNGDGTATITGDLTLLEKTESITFPATVSTEGGLTLKAEFAIDRTLWGMNFGTDNVEKEVPMTITVGG